MGAAPGWQRCASETYRTFQETTDGPVLASGAWHHVAAVWNARARHARVYLDGKLHRELPLLDADRLEPIRGLHLGGNRAGDGVADWDGWIDNVAIVDVGLTARQIAALARGGDVSAGNVLARIPRTGNTAHDRRAAGIARARGAGERGDDAGAAARARDRARGGRVGARAAARRLHGDGAVGTRAQRRGARDGGGGFPHGRRWAMI